ncbi:MAG: histidine--tRNA ligase [Chloroflexota bacterium]
MAKNQVIRSVKGTRDYYPEEMGVRIWLYENMRQVSEAFGYSEYEGPILETFELYAAKSGEEIVEKQSYVFEDRGGDKLTLRPELTPTLARMVASRQPQLTFPLRWWSFGPFWRYERPQKGRTREFFQWNIDMIGNPSPEADAELIAIAATFLKQVGLAPNEAKILVNNRRLMESEIEALGIDSQMRADVFGLIDRKDKMKPETWLTYAAEIGLNPAQIGGIETMITDKDLWQKSDELKRIFTALDSYGITEYVEFAPQIIRGLLYYTGTVFEAWDTAGDFRALFGGGRYDNLVGDVGGQPVGGVGFAVGDLVISLLIDKLGKLPSFGNTPAPIYITLFEEALSSEMIQLAQELRSAGFKVTNQTSPDKLGRQFKFADRIGARLAVVVGPDEQASQQVTIKDLSSGEQQTVARTALEKTLHQLLEA